MTTGEILLWTLAGVGGIIAICMVSMYIRYLKERKVKL